MIQVDPGIPAGGALQQAAPVPVQCQCQRGLPNSLRQLSSPRAYLPEFTLNPVPLLDPAQVLELRDFRFRHSQSRKDWPDLEVQANIHTSAHAI